MMRIIRFGPHGRQLVAVAPDENHVTVLEFHVSNLFFRKMKVASFDGNDMNIRILHQLRFNQPLSQHGGLGRYDEFDHQGFILGHAEGKAFFRRGQRHRLPDRG